MQHISRDMPCSCQISDPLRAEYSTQQGNIVLPSLSCQLSLPVLLLPNVPGQIRTATSLCAPQGSCPEDSLDAATIAGGYKWVPDALRITEANEPLLSLTCHNAAYWERHNADALRQVRHTGGPWCNGRKR
jgi:hypothetical protein